MTFPTYISNIFRIVICVTLTWEIGYLFKPELRITDSLYTAIVKIAVCFTCLISYINDKEKMLVISNSGLVVEKMLLEAKTLPEKFSFIYILIAIIYNPILPFFYSYTYWTIAHVVTISFLVYKIWYFKKQTKE